MTSGPDSSQSGYGVQPGEYGVDTAHGIVPIVIGQAYGADQGPSRIPPSRPSAPRSRASMARSLRILIIQIALAIVLTAGAALLVYPLVH